MRAHPRRRLLAAQAAVLVMLLPFLTGHVWHGRAEEISKDQVQATMLLQVLRFVEWPQQNVPSQMRICILGGGRFQSAMEAVARNESWQGRPIAVAGIEKAAQAEECQVTYVVTASEREIQSLLVGNAKPVLTVSHRDGFARRGGMVNFVPDRDRIALEVNPDAGERLGIRFSSKLLRLARIVRSGVAN